MPEERIPSHHPTEPQTATAATETDAADAGVLAVDPEDCRGRRMYRRPWRRSDEPDAPPRRPGLWLHRNGSRGRNAPDDIWICAPFAAAACEFEDRGAAGILLDFEDRHGQTRSVTIPRSALVRPERVLETFLDADFALDLDHGRELVRHLNALPPGDRRIHIVFRCGWSDDLRSFVLPDGVVGDADVRLDPKDASRGDWCSGTFEGWREVVALAEGNPVFVLAISFALAGALVRPLRCETCPGLHLYGSSTSGKTTALRAATSVWGPAEGHFLRSWNGTRNGLEGWAVLCNDMTLGLDELGEAEARDLQSLVYKLANGVGRARARRDGSAADTRTWKLTLLSTGEHSFDRALETIGRRTTLGMEVRFVELAIRDANGLFEETHGFGAAGLAERITRGVTAHHGHAGPAFVQAILEYGIEAVRSIYEEVRCDPLFATGSGPAARAARVFALAATAGTIAEEAGIVGWKPGCAIAAARTCFERWREDRPPDDLAARALARLRAFVDRHGDARFGRLGKHGEELLSRVPARVGWYDPDDGPTWLFTTEGFREAIGDLDPGSAARALADAGALVVGTGSDRLTVRRRIEGTQYRLYAVRFPEEPGEEDLPHRPHLDDPGRDVLPFRRQRCA